MSVKCNLFDESNSDLSSTSTLSPYHCGNLGFATYSDIKPKGNLTALTLRYLIYSSPEPNAPGQLIGEDSCRRPSVRSLFKTLIYLIKIKFRLEHHWGGGLAA